MKRFVESAVFASLVLLAGNVLAQSISFQGQASGWLALTKKSEIGLRYIPELRVAGSLDDERTIDAEIALNSRISMPFDSPGEGDSDVDIYRLWLRYSSSQFETRLGLYLPPETRPQVKVDLRYNISQPKLVEEAYVSKTQTS